jgi:hypothetical protein
MKYADSKAQFLLLQGTGPLTVGRTAPNVCEKASWRFNSGMLMKDFFKFWYC